MAILSNVNDKFPFYGNFLLNGGYYLSIIDKCLRIRNLSTKLFTTSDVARAPKARARHPTIAQVSGRARAFGERTA
jgi:hypothetical protein